MVDLIFGAGQLGTNDSVGDEAEDIRQLELRIDAVELRLLYERLGNNR